MSKKKDDEVESRVLSGIQEVKDQLDEADDTLDVPARLIKTLQGYRNTRRFIPRVLQSDDKQSVRQAQSSLHQIQEALDKIITVHFAIRRRLELLLQFEIEVKHVLVASGALPDNASGPRVQNCIAKWIPELAKHQARWNEMDKLCGTIQGHLKTAMKVIELQMKLDDNVLWAQYRS